MSSVVWSLNFYKKIVGIFFVFFGSYLDQKDYFSVTLWHLECWTFVLQVLDCLITEWSEPRRHILLIMLLESFKAACTNSCFKSCHVSLGIGTFNGDIQSCFIFVMLPLFYIERIRSFQLLWDFNPLWFHFTPESMYADICSCWTLAIVIFYLFLSLYLTCKGLCFRVLTMTSFQLRKLCFIFRLT